MMTFASATVPARAGTGLRPPHYQALADLATPTTHWLEVHPENYFADGGKAHRWLEYFRQSFPLSFHSVGMSLGSAEKPDVQHLARLKELIDIYQPGLVSDHVSWSRTGGTYYPDLLPVPYTEEALQTLVRNIDIVQENLQRPILVENPSTYVQESAGDYSETAFLNTLCERSGCGLLLDFNNVVVSCHNHGWSAEDYIAAIKPDYVGEMHLSGHARQNHENGCSLRVDDHGSVPCTDTWALLTTWLETTRQVVPVLVEWDSNLPHLQTLLAEARKADDLLTAQSKKLRYAS